MKHNLKKATGVDTSKFAKKVNLASPKLDDDDLDVDKLITVPADLYRRLFLFEETRFSRQAEGFLVFLPYEPKMFLKLFLIKQVQITIPKMPMFL